MSKNLYRLLIILLIVAICGETDAKSQEPEESVAYFSRPVIGNYRIEIGGRKALSTYLSPFFYSGTDYAVSGYWTKMLPQNPAHLAMYFEGKANLGDMLNPAHTAREIDLHANLRWGLEWQTRLNGRWLLGVGGDVGLYGGMLYLPRNGNNPVSAQFAAGISAMGHASKVVEIARFPILLSDRLTLPLLGGFFMPGYGEPYYEIYLGNHKGLAHFGWPGNRFGVDNLLSVTLDFGRTALEVGYRFSMQNEHANNLTTRIFNNALVVGIIPGGIGLKQPRKDIITPLY